MNDGPTANTRLVLEVSINGRPSDFLWEFEQLPDGRLSTTAGRLTDLGFAPGTLGGLSRGQTVLLDELPGTEYHYDILRQAVEIDADDKALIPVVLDTSRAPEPLDIDQIESSTGAVLGYGVYADISAHGVAVSGNYDFRLLSPFGLVTSNGLMRYSSIGRDGLDHVRLDTYWRYVDPRRVMVFSIGDILGRSGELGTIYRLGGVQIQRNFGDRPDIITTSNPILSGSAAVPSAVDLYINGIRYFTGETGRGPFEFRSLPNIGNGMATIVMTDSLGRETRIEKPLFFAPELLAPGLIDFSVEVGLPRYNYGLTSFDYLRDLAGSASVRYGLNDWLTVEGHIEGTDHFGNASAAAAFRLGAFGVVRGMAAISHSDGTVDTHYALQARAHYRGINFYGAVERSNAGYNDIVREVAVRTRYGPENRTGQFLNPRHEPLLLAFSSKTERAGLNFSLLDTGVGFDYTRARLPRQDIRLASVSLSRMVFGASVWANGFKDFGDRKDYGLFAGFSVSFGNGIFGSTGLSKGPTTTGIVTRISRSPHGRDNGLGWNIIDAETLSGSGESYRAASVRYEGDRALVGAGIETQGGSVRGNMFVEGALVAMGGGVFTSRRIDNSFAIVTGAGADTPVMVNTRSVARTDSSGRALVPYLASFRPNSITINPINLPIDQQPARTRISVVPGDRAGVIIDFGVAQAADAIVILVDDEGIPLPLGSFVTREEGEHDAVVGYDGRVYLTGLSPHNQVRVERNGAPDCVAEFDFVPEEGRQVTIGPVPCR